MGLQALLKVNLRLAATNYLSNGYNGPSLGVTLLVCCSVRVHLSRCMQQRMAEHIVFTDVIVSGD